MTENSLRRRLLSSLAWPLLPILVLAALIALHPAWRAAQDASDLTLLDGALDLSHQIRLVDGKPALDLSPVAQQMRATNNGDHVFFVIKSQSGEYIAGDPALSVITYPGGQNAYSYYETAIAGRPLRAITLRTALGAQDLFVVVAQTLAVRDKMFGEVLLSMLVPEILLVCASVAAIWFGVRRGLRPVTRLRDEILSRSQHDLRPIEESSAPEELRPVLHGINELLGRLEVALVGQQRMIADAAHQLRTPLAVLRAQIEVALAKPESQLTLSLQQMLATTERTTRLANQLLSLARAEHAHVSADLRHGVDLKALVTELAEEWVPIAAAQGKDLGFDLEPASIIGDALLLREMLVNLIDNAVRYSNRDGAITVYLSAGDAAIALQVEDDGPGIPQGERGNVMQRFYRLPGTQMEGCGLGLAIVGEIVRLHGAELSLSAPQTGTGLTVTIRFPQPASLVCAQPGLRAAA